MSKNAVINIKFAADLNEFSKQIDVAYAKMRKMSDGLQRVGETMTLTLTLPIALMGAAAVKSYAEIEKLQLGLQNVMGDAGAAATEYQKLLKTAKMPGIGLKEAVEGSIRLQTIGFTADRARTALEGLANAVASVGKGKFELDRAVYGLEQLANTEHPLQQDINILRNAIPQTVPILKKAFADIKNVNAETLSAAGITSKQVVDALIEGYAQLPKFAGGIQNAFDNIADSYLKASGAIGEAINKNLSIQKSFEALGAAMEKVAFGFRDSDSTLQTFLLSMGGILLVAGPLVFAIGSIGKALVFLGATTMSVLPITAAIIGLAAAIAFFSTKSQDWVNKNEMIAQSGAGADEAVKKETGAFEDLYQSLKDTTIPQEKRNQLLKEFNRIAGTSISFANDEKKTQEELAKAYDNTRKAMERKAKSEYYTKEEARLEQELELTKMRAMRENKQAQDLFKEMTWDIGGKKIVNAPLSSAYLYLTGQTPEDVYQAGLKAVADVQTVLNAIRAKKAEYEDPMPTTGGTPAKTQAELDAELKAQKDAWAKHQDLLLKADETFGDKTLDQTLKTARKKINAEWAELTAAEKKKRGYKEYVEEQLYKVKLDWIDKNAELEKNKEKERVDGKKQVTDDLVKQEYDKATKLELQAKNAYDGSIAGEYAYNDKLYNIQLQALENEIKIREKADEKVDELNIKKRDMIINHNLDMNQRQADVQEKYNSLFAKLQDLEAQRYTTKNAQKIAEIKRQLADLQAYAKSVNIEIDPAPMVDSLTEMQVRTQETFAQMNNIIESFIIDTIGAMFDAIAENVAQNLDPFQDIGFVLLKSLGNLFSQLGGLFIAFGLNLELFKNSVESLNGYAAIAAGVALLAVGAAINAVAKKGLQSQSSSTGNYNAQTKSSGGDVVLVTRVDGRDLELVGGRTTYVRRR